MEPLFFLNGPEIAELFFPQFFVILSSFLNPDHNTMELIFLCAEAIRLNKCFPLGTYSKAFFVLLTVVKTLTYQLSKYCI